MKYINIPESTTFYDVITEPSFWTHVKLKTLAHNIAYGQYENTCVDTKIHYSNWTVSQIYCNYTIN